MAAAPAAALLVSAAALLLSLGALAPLLPTAWAGAVADPAADPTAVFVGLLIPGSFLHVSLMCTAI